MQIASLYRYPVKGFSPEPLVSADLTAGSYFPGDRVFAIENGPSGFDPAEPRHLPKIKFLVLMRNAALARLRTRLDDGTGEFAVEGDGDSVTADPSSPEGRLSLEA